jgi:hypothetical protein
MAGGIKAAFRIVQEKGLATTGWLNIRGNLELTKGNS